MARVSCRWDLNVIDMSSDKEPVIKIQRLALRCFLLISPEKIRVLGQNKLSEKTRESNWQLHSKGISMLHGQINDIVSKVHCRLGSYGIDQPCHMCRNTGGVT